MCIRDRYVLLLTAVTLSYISRAQEPQQQQTQPQQQQQNINIYPPDTSKPAPAPAQTTTPAPAPTATEPSHDNDGGLMLGFRYMPTISSFDVRTSQGVAEADFVLSHGFGGFIGVRTSEHFNFQLEIIYLK